MLKDDINHEINRAISVLEQGGVILYPTDTVWGLGCDATNAEAVQKIFAIKQRSESKSLIILLPDAKDIFTYVANPHPDVVDIIKAFEKPTTVIYPQAIGIADNAISEDGSVAIRIISTPFAKSLLKRFKKPLVSTSANISGMPTPPTFSAISEEIKQAVDYAVNLQQEDETVHAPSRIVRINDDGSLVIIRA